MYQNIPRISTPSVNPTSFIGFHNNTEEFICIGLSKLILNGWLAMNTQQCK